VVEQSLLLRCVLYRLRRQGMLELEAWLQPLEPAMQDHIEIHRDVEALLAMEPPDIEYIMHHPASIPMALRSFLIVDRYNA